MKVDSGRPQIKFATEADMEEVIYRETLEMGRCPITRSRVHSVLRQLEIPGYGRCDLIKVNHCAHGTIVTVMELKNEAVGPAHVNQVCRYMTGIRRSIHRLPFLSNSVQVFGEVVGTGVNRDYVWMFQEIGIDVYTLDVDFNDGVTVSRVEDWRMKSESLTALNGAIAAQIALRREVEHQMDEGAKKRLKLVRETA